MGLRTTCKYFDGYAPCVYLASRAVERCNDLCQFFTPSPTPHVLAVHLGAAGDIVRCLTLYQELAKNCDFHLLHDSPEVEFLLEQQAFQSHVLRSDISYLHNIKWERVYCLDKSHQGIAVATQFRKSHTQYIGWLSTDGGKIVASSPAFDELWHLGAEGGWNYDIEKSYQTMLADAVGVSLESAYPDMSTFDDHLVKKTVLLCDQTSGRFYKRWHGWNGLYVELQDLGYDCHHHEMFQSLSAFAHYLCAHEYVITMDSLPMHLALLFRRKTVALFGSTPLALIDFMDVGVGVEPRSDCLYCYRRTCKHQRSCFASITVEDVLSALEKVNSG